MGFRGRLAKAYYETTWDDGENIIATPVWAEVKKAVDISFAGGESDADGSSRESDVNMDVGGGQDRTVTLQYRIDQLTDVVYENVFVASKTLYRGILMQFMNGDRTTSTMKGWQQVVRAKEVQEDWPNDGPAIATITLVPWPGRDASGVIIPVSRVTIA